MGTRKNLPPLEEEGKEPKVIYIDPKYRRKEEVKLLHKAAKNFPALASLLHKLAQESPDQPHKDWVKGVQCMTALSIAATLLSAGYTTYAIKERIDNNNMSISTIVALTIMGIASVILAGKTAHFIYITNKLKKLPDPVQDLIETAQEVKKIEEGEKDTTIN